MDATDDYGSEWLEVSEDVLLDRLRNLSWPDAQPELRSRCWAEISRRMSERDETASATRRGSASGAEPYGYSRRRPPERHASPAIWSRLIGPPGVPYRPRPAFLVN